MLLEGGSQLVRGGRAGGELQLRIERGRQLLHRPRLQMNHPLTDERTRARTKCRAIIRDTPPRERTEEPNCVVLGAVTLPVAGNDLLAPARGLASSARSQQR
jgi:hypothetical protein